MKRLKWLSLLLTAIFVTGCSNTKENEIKSVDPLMVYTAESKEDTYQPGLNYSGVALPFQEANLGTPLPGRVEKVFYKTGDYVKKGALIVRLSHDLLEQSNAELDAINKDYERVKRLHEKGSLTQQDLDHMTAKQKATQAKNDMFMSFSEIRAPFAGKLVGFLVNEGEVFVIAPGLKPGYSMTSGIVRLMNMDKIKVCIEVNEKEYALIQQGMKARVSFDALPEKVYQGSVKRKDDYLSTMTHTAEVEVLVDNPGELIKPGMFSRVSLELKEQSAVFVPQEAIFKLEGTGEEFVYSVDKSVVHRLAVRRGGFKEDLVAVDGLEAGMEVLTTGLRKVKDGDRVTVSK
jgi:membrane fusion protein, multidrug efflux system